MTVKKKSSKTVIGWREYVDLPEWGVRRLRAKIDTGARTSSLHVDDIKLLKDGRISFYVVLDTKPPVLRKKVIAKRVKRGRVKSSVGHRTERWYVETEIVMGPLKGKILINLVSRDEMNHRMLIGRKAMEGCFLVDVTKSFLLGKSSAKKER